MKRTTCALFCGFIAILLSGIAIPRQVNGPSEVPTQNLVGAVRTINTAEVLYKHENGRFASRDEILAFLPQKGFSSKASIDLENPKPYELAVTTSPDGMHYQITLQWPSDLNDKSTWCKTAAFSSERGVIFLGVAIDCEAAPK